MKTIKKFLRIDRREICFLKFILEAYDGIATLTTIDPHQGIVLLRIAPGCEDEVETILRSKATGDNLPHAWRIHWREILRRQSLLSQNGSLLIEKSSKSLCQFSLFLN